LSEKIIFADTAKPQNHFLIPTSHQTDCFTVSGWALTYIRMMHTYGMWEYCSLLM